METESFSKFSLLFSSGSGMLMFFGSSNIALGACVLDGLFFNSGIDFCKLISCFGWFLALGGGHFMKYICKQDAIKDRPARKTTTFTRNEFFSFNVFIVLSRLFNVANKSSSNLAFSSLPFIMIGILIYSIFLTYFSPCWLEAQRKANQVQKVCYAIISLFFVIQTIPVPIKIRTTEKESGYRSGIATLPS